VLLVRQHFPGFETAFEAVKNLVENALREFRAIPEKQSR
jgi:hypothetical protein